MGLYRCYECGQEINQGLFILNHSVCMKCSESVRDYLTVRLLAFGEGIIFNLDDETE